jgi:hypothetical protein
MPLTPEQEKECLDLLKKSILLKYCSDESIKLLLRHCERKEFKKGDILLKQGDPSVQMFVIAEGDVVRHRLIDNQLHHIDTQKCGTTVGSLHLIREDPVYATAKANSDRVVAYTLKAEDLRRELDQSPKLSQEVIYSLTREIRNYTKAQRTPLLEQHAKKTPYMAVSIAASIESFYRSALNSLLNARLSGNKNAPLFPNMHIQIPTRVVYINGFKGIRQYLDEQIRLEEVPTHIRLGAAITPGIIMTPVSSYLEACNAVQNKEPLIHRWRRGYIPRTGREIIFGVGLNQLSDWCEERVPNTVESPVIKNALGSMAAGVMSGYISHVPHNMATLKMLDPSKTYAQHFATYCERSRHRVPTFLPTNLQNFTCKLIACVFPLGVTIRTGQIVGSYIILNGIINALQKRGDK